jgi:hypothetical protein
MRIMLIIPIIVSIFGIGTLLISFISDLSEDEPISIDKQNSRITSISMEKLRADANNSGSKTSSYSKNNEWISSFEENKNQDFFYPVTEVSINMPLDKVYRTVAVYNIETEQLEPYQHFCVSQVINKFGVNHSVKESQDKIKFYIYTQSDKKAKRIIEELKYYDIKSILKTRIKEEG